VGNTDPGQGGRRAAESGPSEPARPRPGQISALIEQLARPPEQDAGEWIGPTAGSSLGRFDLLRELGRGGFGVVFEARDRELGRIVALKAIRPGPRPLAEARRRWLRQEAEAVAQLSHPNIVTLHDLGTSERGPYLVLEMLHGETLQERLARGALPAAEAVAVAVDLARALAHAHAHGVLHRDLKPSNVFLTEDGEVKVLDFGLAHFFGTSGMRGGGTPGYMAPEQWRGDPEDPRTDVFGLGVLLFEMLTARLPYRVSRDRSTALDPGPPPALALPDAPPALAALVASALSKSPGGRPRDGRATLDALVEVQRAFSRGEVEASPGAARGRSARRFCPRPRSPPPWWSHSPWPCGSSSGTTPGAARRRASR
jgi:serine/threonine protein kinase